PLELIAERVDGTDDRFAPGHELSGSGLGARRVHQLRIFSRQTRRASQCLRPGLHFSSDLRSPPGTVRRDLEGNPRALDTTDLPAFGEQRGDESRKSSDVTAEDTRKHLRLAFVRAVVDEDASAPLGLSCPEITFPSSHSDEAQTVEIDIAEVALSDMPEQNGLAEAVIGSLSEGAGTRDGAAAIVEPITCDVPAGSLGHEDLHSPWSTIRRLVAARHRPPPPAARTVMNHTVCAGTLLCSAAKLIVEWQRWVNSVGPNQAVASSDVRFAPESGQTLARLAMSA